MRTFFAPSLSLLIVSCGASDPCLGRLQTADGRCVEAILCGAGTELQGNECVSVTNQTCGQGTTLVGSECVSTVVMVSCGAGTTPSATGDECVGTLSCGAGTQAVNGTCQGTLSCGSGTQQVGSSCQSSLSCGTGTTPVSGSCRPNLGLICGTDTAPANGNTTCVGTVTCGANTMRVGSACVSVGGSCGTGTLLQNGACVVPAPTTSLTTWMRQPGLRTASDSQPSMVVMGFTTPSWRDMILTDFAQVFADQYVSAGTAPVGTGKALHFATYAATIGLPMTLPVTNDVQADGGCKAIDPRSTSGGLRLTYADWANASYTTLACGLGGVVQITPVGNTLQLTLNVQFSDGTLLQNEMLTLPK